MNANLLHSPAFKSASSPIILLTKPCNPIHNPTFPCRRPRPLRAASGSGDGDGPVPPAVTPPDGVGIRFRRLSRRQSRQKNQQREEGVVGDGVGKRADAAPRPKKWEEMNLTEKATELYVGEKGLLFWLNKFAYASIFIVIGGWILFRFVGPALNLYQLDSAPLSPSSMFKGS